MTNWHCKHCGTVEPLRVHEHTIRRIEKGRVVMIRQQPCGCGAEMKAK